MKNYKTFLIALIFLIAQIFEASAQYKKLTKGQPNPFDTAVAVRIDRYRAETLKLKFASTLVDSLIKEIDGLYKEIAVTDSVNFLYNKQVFILQTANIRKDSVNQVLYNDFKTLYDIHTKEKPFLDFFKKPEGIGLSLIILIEVVRLFTQ